MQKECQMKKIKSLAFGITDGKNKIQRPHREWVNDSEGWCRASIRELSYSGLFSSDRQHLSYDVCLEVRRKRKDYQNCSVLYCVLKLCTVISTLRWAVLGIGFCHNGPISLCVDLFVWILCVFVSYSILWARWGGPDGIEV